ncbi:MAG: ABC transporter permease subunit [Actinobacteria bacterium]|nr:ABC transporter permease subunit [Actinomycetota bacterium]
MIGSVAAELLVVRKRTSTWILLTIWTLLATFFSYVLPYPEATAGASLAELLPESLPATLMRVFPFFGGVFALMLGVLTVGSDYAWDTLKTLFTQRPGRLHVLAAKLLALGTVLVAFVLALFLAGALASYTVAHLKGAAVDWPSAWLLVRAVAAGWFILAVWAALGVLLAVLSRGTALAIGIGILYSLVVEGLVSALVGSVSAIEPLAETFIRTNAYSIAKALGTSPESIADAGPASFSGPYVGSAQALLILAAYLAASVLVTALVLRRRDVS